jgi:pimeloyl-ACP methyl ester carboxylesterase
MFAAGERDVVLRMVPDAAGLVSALMPECRSSTVIPGAGHWIQQERPAEINKLLLAFVKQL